MKTLLTIIIAVATITIGLANTSPVTTGPENLISTATVEITALNIDQLELIKSAHYNEVEDRLEFTTAESVDMIQIFNSEGNLQFQLPVMSNQVKISKALFSQGDSKLGFIIAGKAEVFMTSVNIK